MKFIVTGFSHKVDRLLMVVEADDLFGAFRRVEMLTPYQLTHTFDHNGCEIWLLHARQRPLQDLLDEYNEEGPRHMIELYGAPLVENTNIEDAICW